MKNVTNLLNSLNCQNKFYQIFSIKIKNNLLSVISIRVMTKKTKKRRSLTSTMGSTHPHPILFTQGITTDIVSNSKFIFVFLCYTL
jgi:hypothetical protein